MTVISLIARPATRFCTRKWFDVISGCDDGERGEEEKDAHSNGEEDDEGAEEGSSAALTSDSDVEEDGKVKLVEQ